LVHVLSSLYQSPLGAFFSFSAAAEKPYIPGINSIKCTVAEGQRESEQSLAAAAINSQTQKNFSPKSSRSNTEKIKKSYESLMNT